MLSFLFGGLVATVILTVYHNSVVVALVQSEVTKAFNAVKAKL